MKKKRENFRKGQFAVFALIGIVLLIMVIIIITASVTIADLNLKKEAQQTVNDYLEASNIDYYIYTCMDSVVKEAVEEFSLQGGNYYESQGGGVKATEPGKTHIPINHTINSEQKEYNVTYSIQNTGYCPIVDSFAPNWPESKTRLLGLYGLYNKESSCLFNWKYGVSGYIGFNNFTKICPMTSENLNPTRSKKSPCFGSQTPFTNMSAEYMLEKIIANKTEKCINFSIFTGSQGHNITVLDKPNATLIITTDSFSITLSYPFIVNLKDKEPVLIRQNFDYESDLRIILIMRYLTNLFSRESKDIFFSIKENYASDNIKDFDGFNMDLEVIEFENCTTCLYRYDTMIKLTDHASKIGNRSLTFYSAIKNRNPALDYIHETSDEDYYDILAEENETINLNPLGIDPENYKVFYDYIGWKETIDEKFDWNGSNQENCSLQWRKENNKSFQPHEILNCTYKNISNQPLNWTNSFEYKRTNRSATFKPKITDIGIHNLTIKVTDKSGKIDWQTLKILVFDKPHVEIKIPKIYEDIPLNIISIEDFFLLNGSESRPSILAGGEITEYLWKSFLIDKNGEKQFEKKTPSTQDYLELPFQTNNIQNISILNLSKKGNHTISLTIFTNTNLITSGQSGTGYKKINVTECVPHNNTEDQIYPYNTKDPFLANHTCCIATNISDPTTYKYQSNTTKCYEQTRYGQLEKLKEYYDNNLNKSANLTEYYKINPKKQTDEINPFTPSSEQENDVYKLEFSAYCDGKRGNICAGKLEALNTQENICLDAEGPNERCSGPESITIQKYLMACKNYTAGTTFESYFEQIGATGNCSNEKKCSTPGNGKYDDDGKAFCVGQCDGNGGCNYAAQCECDITKCDAECDGKGTTDPTTINGKWMCEYACAEPNQPNACTFTNKEQWPCTNGKTFCDTDPGTGITCTWDIKCTNTGIKKEEKTCRIGQECTANGCIRQ